MIAMILQEIAEKTRERINLEKRTTSLEQLRSKAEQTKKDEEGNIFLKALQGPGLSLICEVKKASPSKGEIVKDFPYLEIAKDYEANGAAAISVLTEPYYFQGKDEYLIRIKEAVKVPILRKDFTIDEYMIYQAKLMGADAILLICSLLDSAKLKEYLAITHSLGMSALVEAHDEAEIEMAVDADAGIVGVNNRNLKNFQVDITNSIRLRCYIPEHVIYVSESGIKTVEDIQRLKEHNVNAVLIGEALMKSRDKGGLIKEFGAQNEN